MDNKTMDKSQTNAELLRACRTGCVEAARRALQSGADANAVDECGWTALMWAAGEGRTNIVRLVLKKGADPHHKNIHGKTAADVADESGHTDCAEFIRAWV
jgi:ankyrin repeat protein